MRVVILCGGKGTRLGSPGQKCCIPIHGRPFLQYRAEQLIRNGATRLWFVTTYEYHDEVRAAIGPGPRIIHDSGHGPFPAIGAAAESVELPFWVANGDTLLEQPLWEAARWTMVTTTAVPRPHNTPRGLDAGLYYVDQSWPPRWNYFDVKVRPYHLNTPKDVEETSAYLG